MEIKKIPLIALLKRELPILMRRRILHLAFIFTAMVVLLGCYPELFTGFFLYKPLVSNYYVAYLSSAISTVIWGFMTVWAITELLLGQEEHMVKEIVLAKPISTGYYILSKYLAAISIGIIGIIIALGFSLLGIWLRHQVSLCPLTITLEFLLHPFVTVIYSGAVGVVLALLLSKPLYVYLVYGIYLILVLFKVDWALLCFPAIPLCCGFPVTYSEMTGFSPLAVWNISTRGFYIILAGFLLLLSMIFFNRHQEGLVSRWRNSCYKKQLLICTTGLFVLLTLVGSIMYKDYRFEEEFGKEARNISYKITDYKISMEIDTACPKLLAETELTLFNPSSCKIRKVDIKLSSKFRVIKVYQENKPVFYIRKGSLISIELKNSLKGQENTRITISYQGNPTSFHFPFHLPSPYLGKRYAFGMYGDFYPFNPKGDGVFKAIISVTVPKDDVVVTIGELEEKRISGNKVTYVYKNTLPERAIFMAIGPYRITKERVGNTTLLFYTSPDHMELIPIHLRDARLSLEYYNKRFNFPCPFKEVKVVEIPYLLGGIGGTSVIFAGERFFTQGNRLKTRLKEEWNREELEKGLLEIADGMAACQDDFTFLSHELSHLWWGGVVFGAGKGGKFLGEGFATYSEILASVEIRGFGKKTRLLAFRDGHRLIAGKDFSIVEAEEKGADYTNIIYEKGALVLHQLRYLVGDAVFFRILEEYLDKNRYKEAGLSQFEEIASKVSGMELDWFFDQWIKGVVLPDYRVLSAKTKRVNNKFKTRAKICNSGTGRMLVPVSLVLNIEDNKRLIQRVWLNSNETTVLEFVSSKMPQAVEIDPEKVILQKDEDNDWRDIENE